MESAGLKTSKTYLACCDSQVDLRSEKFVCSHDDIHSEKYLYSRYNPDKFVEISVEGEEEGYTLTDDQVDDRGEEPLFDDYL